MTFTRTAEARSLGQVVAANVRAEAARAGLTNQQLAERAGVSPWLMSRRLRGQVPINVDELETLADALGVRPEVLLGRPTTSAA